MTDDELRLRRLLAFAYSGTHLYGDDGELQDGRHPMIDYMRDSVTDIERKITQRGMDLLAHRQSQCEHVWVTTFPDNYKHENYPYCNKCFKVKS